MTALYVAAAIGLVWCVYRVVVLLERAHDTSVQEPRLPQVRQALDRVMAQEPVREPCKRYDGDQRHRAQFKLVQRYKKASGQ